MNKYNIWEGKNLIPIIAKELGVDIEEEFYLDDTGNKYKFTNTHLMYKHDKLYWQKAITATIWLINGKFKIIKKVNK